MMKRKVLLTGAAGRIGRFLTNQWKKRYELHLTDLRRPDETFDFPFSETDLANLWWSCQTLFGDWHGGVHGSRSTHGSALGEFVAQQCDWHIQCLRSRTSSWLPTHYFCEQRQLKMDQWWDPQLKIDNLAQFNQARWEELVQADVQFSRPFLDLDQCFCARVVWSCLSSLLN